MFNEFYNDYAFCGNRVNSIGSLSLPTTGTANGCDGCTCRPVSSSLDWTYRRYVVMTILKDFMLGPGVLTMVIATAVVLMVGMSVVLITIIKYPIILLGLPVGTALLIGRTLRRELG